MVRRRFVIFEILLVLCACYSSASEHRKYLDVIPEFKVSLLPNTTGVLYEGRCFQEYAASFSVTPTKGVITFTVKKRYGLVCTDWFLFASREDIRLKGFTLDGTHHYEISEWKAGEFEDVQENGLQVFLVAQDMLVTIFDAWESWRIFHGKHTSKQAQREIETYMNFTYTERAKTVVALPEAMIQTGDVFAITRMDSTDLFIQIGCGSRVGHVAIAVWMEGVLHVCEAVGANHCDGLWPAPHGIICTPYSRWLNLGLAVDYLTSFLPLHPQYRARLNEADLVSFVESVLGLPYGNNNFFYTWLDTPEDNFPPPLSSATVVVGLPMYERIYKLPYNDSSSAYTFVIAGMNKRLGIDCTDSNCLFRYLDDMNITFTDAMIISEQDSWTYSGNRSLVCSSFVLASLKAAGVFGDLDFQATEAQPGDIYRLQIYDDTWNKPDGCATETGPTCQLMGALNLDLPDANTVNPHANMFSRCGGVPPDYSRTPNC